MPHNPEQTLLYHITDVANLPDILAAGGLHSDAVISQRGSAVVIGYAHIKQRRLQETTVDCCGGRFVGEFVPFYFCPRSPMLLTINSGNTGRPIGCQQTIVHLVSRVSVASTLERPWAISDSNAGARYPSFYSSLTALEELDWGAINARQWQGKASQKAAEFLVADFFPWTAFHSIGCHNKNVEAQVRNLLKSQQHSPAVSIQPTWYY